ncbi:transcriptional regulator, AraC family [Leptolyngbya sp. NIES-3755]|nr:transcriptional regulator, AraC family [Leptolyngbya sp. NIES-3755]
MSGSQIRLIDTETAQMFPAAPDESVTLSSAALNWQGILIEQHSIGSMELPEHYVQGHRLIVQTGEAVEYEWKENDHWQHKILQPGAFCLQTHGEINFPRWHDRFEFLAIALDPTFVEQSFQDVSTSIQFQTQRAVFDPVIADFAKRFSAEVRSRSYCGALYGESLAIAFSRHLLERYHHRSLSIVSPRGKFSSIQLRDLIDFIHVNLSEELSLTELAAHLNLSPFHFARLFKNSLGLSPHQYVLQNRIDRAKKLITVSTGSTLADIAVQVGFYDQTHFGKAFKRVVGVSPKVFSKHC